MAVFTCPQCGHLQFVDDRHVGKKATCPKCKTQDVVLQSAVAANTPGKTGGLQSGNVRKRTAGKLGIHFQSCPERSVWNNDSTIVREWIIIDSPDLPVQFNDIYGVMPHVDLDDIKRNVYRADFEVRTIGISATAVEVRFLTFDVWGEHVRTLSAMVIKDMGADSAVRQIEKWSLFSDNEAWEYLACIGYIARVRTAEGMVLYADTGAVLREAQLFTEKFTEADLGPKAPK